MPQAVDLPLLFAIIAAAILVVGLGLSLLTLSLQERNKHRKRLARVSKRRLSGRLDFEDVRRTIVRAQEDTNVIERLTHLLARVIPLLDTVRLRASLNRAGLKLTITGFVVWSLGIAALLLGAAFLLSGLPWPLLVLPALLLGMFLMNAFVQFRGEVVSNRFMKQLPDALDTIIRGIRSGLPVVECIATAGQESPEPIGPHFRAVSERVQLGETLDSALWRVARVIGRPEVDFFAVTIAIQAETGGSLAEALGNLSELLRRREHMKLKIKAISSEAKASALIIGALPFVMLGLLLFVSPEYVMPLFTDPRGQVMLGCALGSIGFGAYVMWRMTQFEI